MKRTSLLLLMGGILLWLAACGAGAPAANATEIPAATEAAPATAEPTVAAPTDTPTEPPPTATLSPTATPPPPTATLTPAPTEPPTAEPTATTPPTAAATEAQAASVAIDIEDFLFTPGRQTVRVGDTVTWTHMGNARHTVTADDGAFDSGSLSAGGTFSFTFDAAGTYAYYCRLHGAPGSEGMSGVITVTE